MTAPTPAEMTERLRIALYAAHHSSQAGLVAYVAEGRFPDLEAAVLRQTARVLIGEGELDLAAQAQAAADAWGRR